MKVLVINAGSSSLKYQLFNMENESVLAKGLCERIGLDGRLVHEVTDKDKVSFDISMPTHKEAIKSVLDTLVDSTHGVLASINELSYVGHRVLTAGEEFKDSVVINDDVIKAIEKCIPLGPLHNPANLTGIMAVKDVLGDIPQVAVFDTAFHQSMPQVNFMYSIPYEYYTKYSIRKYGFHGTSHKYVSEKTATLLNKPVEDTKIITCHLGNGASLCAVKGGKCFDTSMGFTPLDGLTMGTRSGAIDASVISYICGVENRSAEDVINMLNKESGVLGLSGLSSDFRDIEDACEQGNDRAILASDIFVSKVKQTIGSYIATMGGLDALVFTAGIGENDIRVREAICKDMEFLGIDVDSSKNNVRGKLTDISNEGSRVKTFVVPTNEELVIARDTIRLVNETK